MRLMGGRPPRAVWGAVYVVPVDPGRQGAVAGGVGAVQPPIGPLLQQGAVEPLDFAVGLRPVGSGGLVAHTGVDQRRSEQAAAVADAVEFLSGVKPGWMSWCGGWTGRSTERIATPCLAGSSCVEGDG
jgi:hypothetical protein